MGVAQDAAHQIGEAFLGGGSVSGVMPSWAPSWAIWCLAAGISGGALWWAWRRRNRPSSVFQGKGALPSKAGAEGEDPRCVRNVLDAVNAAVVVLDLEGKVRDLNRYAQEISGFALAEVLDQEVWSVFMPKEERGDAEDWWAQFIVSPEAEGISQGAWISKQGERRVMTWSARKQVGADGVTTGVVAVGLDTTSKVELEEDRKRLEGQLHQAQKMDLVGQLAGGVAHDMNNMLTVILGHLDMIQDEVTTGSPILRHIAPMERVVKRSRDIVKQLLVFSRKQAGDTAELCDLNALIAELSASLGVLIGEDIHLITRYSEALWLTRIDPAQLNQVLINLVVNARDAMPNGGPIMIETANHVLRERALDAHPGRYVVMAVVDAGIGMDEGIKARIFEPYFTTKDVGKGTGLGLSTVFGIVRRAGGFIRVQSDIGMGTTFQVFIPAATSEEDEPEIEEVRANQHWSGTVLVVEDEEDLREAVALQLRVLGFRVIEVASAVDAMVIVRDMNARLDLVLSDVVMPMTNGFELADQIEQIRPGLKILLMSGYAGDIIAKKFAVESGREVIAKPFGKAGLAVRIEALLGPGRHR